MQESQKKVEKVIDSILKNSRMIRKEFEEVKGIEKEMKESGKIEILTPMLKPVRNHPTCPM